MASRVNEEKKRDSVKMLRTIGHALITLPIDELLTLGTPLVRPWYNYFRGISVRSVGLGT